MTKKEYCNTHKAIAYFSGFGTPDFVVKGIEGCYLYAVSDSLFNGENYHKLLIRYNINGDAYIRLYGCVIPINNCLIA